MSGGSYDYLCHKMDRGEIDPFEQWAGQLDDDLRQLAAELRSGEVSTYVNHELVSHPDPGGAAEAADAARDRVASMRARIASLQADVRALASLCHDVEWWRSGDYGADQAAEACVALALKRP